MQSDPTKKPDSATPRFQTQIRVQPSTGEGARDIHHIKDQNGEKVVVSQFRGHQVEVRIGTNATTVWMPIEEWRALPSWP